MKVYVRQNSVVLVGKAWEIRSKLKEYTLLHEYVSTWITSLKEK